MSDPAPQLTPPTMAFENAPAPSLAAGERFGDYVLLEEIGRGGMGVVHRAYEVGLDRVVAIKMILSGGLSEPEELTRFRTEASAAGKLQHPNIVKVHRVGIEGDRHYYAMDYIQGQSLAQRLADGPLPCRLAARYLVKIAGAIQHAHEQGILHRDLKPGNILIDATDEPHVADFGLAKQMRKDTGQTRTGALLGTPGYMAPEQASASRELTPATDVYGLGALLYELLTARPPFRGETAYETLLQVINNEPAPPRLLNARIDRDLETICLKCLQKNPRDRYGSAAEMARDLERYLSGESIQARSLNVLEQIGRSLERSHFDTEFGRYAHVIFWFAGIVGLMHLVEFGMLLQRFPVTTVRSIKIVQFGLMALVVYRYHPHGLMPASQAERLLWSVWGGYVAACSMIGHLLYSQFGEMVLYEGVIYPVFCVITGMAFLIIGSSYWGMCNIIALAFLGMALVLPAIPGWGCLVFGAMWTLALLAIAFRLRRLARQVT
ncbi:MAG: serine/threonine-protein kinase [Gemmataceae bacterium]